MKTIFHSIGFLSYCPFRLVIVLQKFMEENSERSGLVETLSYL